MGYLAFLLAGTSPAAVATAGRTAIAPTWVGRWQLLKFFGGPMAVQWMLQFCLEPCSCTSYYVAAVRLWRPHCSIATLCEQPFHLAASAVLYLLTAHQSRCSKK